MSLAKVILPEGILDYFEIKKVDNTKAITIYLEEKNNPPRGSATEKYISKGFYEAATIQDFPIREKACYLNIKRRKWIAVSTGKIVHNDYVLSAQGTKMTKELATFLKGTD